MPQNPGLATPTPPLGHCRLASLLSQRTSILSATGFRACGDEHSVPIVICAAVPILYQGSMIDGTFKPPASKPEDVTGAVIQGFDCVLNQQKLKPYLWKEGINIDYKTDETSILNKLCPKATISRMIDLL